MINYFKHIILSALLWNKHNMGKYTIGIIEIVNGQLYERYTLYTNIMYQVNDHIIVQLDDKKNHKWYVVKERIGVEKTFQSKSINSFIQLRCEDITNENKEKSYSKYYMPEN